MLIYKNGDLDLVTLGQKLLRQVHRNYSTAKLYEEIINNHEGQICHGGPIVVRTGHAMRCPPSDKFIVRDKISTTKVYWDQQKVLPMELEKFETLLYRLIAYLQNKEVYVQYLYACKDPNYRTPIRIITETAWHSLFARSLFEPIRTPQELEKINHPEKNGEFATDFSIVHIPGFQAIPKLDGTNSNAFVIINMELKLVVIGGTSYAGEIRQAIFTMLNYALTDKKVLPMRCSANQGPSGVVSLFVGREGSGKTTLAVDPQRNLIGDHGHGWSEDGIFTYANGGYARILNISKENEPQIHACTHKFGSILENVSINLANRQIDLNDTSLTDNIRVAYPFSHISGEVTKGNHGHPQHLFLLTCDACGVLPPIARLTSEQAVYGFLSSYTSKLQRTTDGKMESENTFDLSFGASTLTMAPHHYGNLLLEKIENHKTNCWMINTGWIGEPCGISERIEISVSRTLINAAINGLLDQVEYEIDPVFQYQIPVSCPGVEATILNPRNLARDQGEFEFRANRLVREFILDFEKFSDEMPPEIRNIFSQVLSFDGFDLLDGFGLSI